MEWERLVSLGIGNGGAYPDVNALVVSGTNLYAGGAFTNAGGIPAKYIARWNGSGWSALGSGMDGSVKALAVNGDTLYAGGNFTNAGGVLVNRIAKWNGSTWSALGSGMGNTVVALAVSGNSLYAGGSFTFAGGSPANYIAKWDGSAWSALGSGMNDSVAALAADETGHLFAGGFFQLVGSKVSPYVVEANIIPQRGVIQNIGAVGGTVALDCLGLPGTAYAVERAADVQFTAGLTTLLTTNAPANGLFRCTDPSPPGLTAFYRLRQE